MGGDEFIVLASGAMKEDERQGFLNRLMDQISQDFILPGATIGLSASIGFASYPKDARTIEDLLRIADARIPCLSIMNMPPLPYMLRLPGIEADAIKQCYTDPTVWDGFDSDLVTLASPDPQAFRPPEEPVNVLQVSLPTNFKVARFVSDEHTAMLRKIEQDIMDIRFDPGDGNPIELPVKLRVYDSVFVPLAKWAMLMTGNYRCVQEDAARSIKEAVHSNLDASKEVYDWVHDLCQRLGADANDMVPFEKYANAAQGLAKPSSAARALFAGAPNIERLDLLVKTLSDGIGMQSKMVEDTVNLVNKRLQINRDAAK